MSVGIIEGMIVGVGRLSPGGCTQFLDQAPLLPWFGPCDCTPGRREWQHPPLIQHSVAV